MSEETKACPGCGLVVPSYVKYCAECGSYIPDNEADAEDVCGEEIVIADTSSNENDGFNAYSAEGYTPNFDNVMSKKDFLHQRMPEIEKSINLACVVCFVLAGLCLPSMFVMFFSVGAVYGLATLLDVAVYVGLGLGGYKSKSKGCILAAAIYYGVGTLLVLGSLSFGVVLVRVAVVACLVNGYIKANQLDKEYNRYLWESQNIIQK